ncbi:hypothetical protein EK21DRAFT_83465 [Setomelanomma holmii]|uniref:Uncharacterized protein n=1 Tax=Setomelanomma holmii TaxID=210430 RepID=A0A9P4HN05_9PLEO|nr:hypothetical protein EK21DRAFT_83465 [Setomelanomma holmii]
MVLKTYQKFQIGNYGLAFSHTFATGVSTGILHGTGAASYGEDYSLWAKIASMEIHQHIQAAQQMWNHPLFLPATIMQHHLIRSDYFCTVVLCNMFTDMQQQLGTTRSGRLYRTEGESSLATDAPVPQAKDSLRDLTIQMNSLMHELIEFCAVSNWQHACLKHLGDILTEIEDANQCSIYNNAMRLTLQRLLVLAESLRRGNNATREHGQADMNILYSLISQVDNRLNARMAAASSHDIAAMKTLAFLTTLFSPGTFIASLFSTSIFD